MSESLTPEQAARLLQVALPCSDGQIKRAYRRLAREHHPDRGGDVRLFHQLQAAFERLAGEEVAGPVMATGRPSRTPATAPRTPSRSELAAIELDIDVPDRPTPLGASLAASALARPHHAPIHPLHASSRAPGARLNRAAAILAADLTSTLRIEMAADDRGRPVVAIEVTAAARRARRALEAAALDGVWIRRRRTSTTQLSSTVEPASDRHRTAVAATVRLVRLLEAVSWPLEQWVLLPSTGGPRPTDGLPSTGDLSSSAG